MSLIKVIKRVEREQSGQEAAVEATRSELSAHVQTREMAATVRGWVSEFQQTRLTRHQQIEQQLGWRRASGEGL